MTAILEREEDRMGAPSPRAQLEQDRTHLQILLHRQSDDFEATARLRAVERALASRPQREGPWAWQERIRPRQRPARSLLRRLVERFAGTGR